MAVILYIFIFSIIPVNSETEDIVIRIEKISEIYTGGAPFDVQVNAPYGFISDYLGGISSFDLASDTYEPSTLVDSLPLPLAHYFHIEEEYAFVACWDSGLKIINISDPTNLTEVGSYYDGVEVGAAFVSNNVAIVSKIDGGVLILNVSDPTNPQKLSQYNATGMPNVCAIRDNIAFVAYWEQTGSRIVFINITEPTTPVFVGQYADTAETYDFQLRDNLLIIANSINGVFFVNITYLGNPVKIAQFDTSSDAVGVDIIDNYAFIGDSNTLEVIDFSNFSNIQIVGLYDDTGATQKLQIVDDLVYACNYPKGLVIFRYTIEEVPSSSSALFIFPILTSLMIITIILNYRRKKSKY